MGNFTACCARSYSDDESMKVKPDGYNYEISGILKKARRKESEEGLVFEAKSAKSLRFICEHGVAVATRVTDLTIIASGRGVFIIGKNFKGLQTCWQDGCHELRDRNLLSQETYVSVVKAEPTYRVGEVGLFLPVGIPLPVEDVISTEGETKKVTSAEDNAAPVTPPPLEKRMCTVTVEDIEDEESVHSIKRAVSSLAVEQHDTRNIQVVLMLTEHGEKES